MFCFKFEKIATSAGRIKGWLKGRGRSIPKKIEKLHDSTRLKGRSPEHYAAIQSGMSKEKTKRIGSRMADRMLSNRQIDFILGLPPGKRTQ